MATEEEKGAEQEPVEQEPLEREPVELEPADQETSEEKKSKNYWWLSLGLILLLLGSGGYYALTGMRQAAHKLGGGSDYEQLSANNSIYEGGRAASREGDSFPLDEEAAAGAAVGASAARINSSLVRTREELVADASPAGSAPSAAAVKGGQEETSAPEAAAQAPVGQAVMAEKLQSRASFSGSAAGSRGAKSAAASSGSAAAFQGSGAAVGKASEQRETKAAAPKKGGRGSMLESLKGAFKASFYGARLSSQDSAKSWIARSFDGSEEATTAIEYDDKMRNKLDKVNPDSIPNFLREQDVSAAEAKTLTASEVAKPGMDKGGTKEALAEDKAYQSRKMAKDFSGSMINGLFAGVSGTGSPEEDPEGPRGLGVYANPEDEQTLIDEELQSWVDMNGFGEECGCTAAAPCCCMPNSGDGAGITGDGLWAGPDSGDFLSAGDGTAFA